METVKLVPQSQGTEQPDSASPELAQDSSENTPRALPSSITPKDWSRGQAQPGAPVRDWSAAIDLVKEAYEAIRIAEERADAAEAHAKQLIQFHADQSRAAEARLAASEKRAAAAEVRTMEAEQWLARFHDTILDGFQKMSARNVKKDSGD